MRSSSRNYQEKNKSDRRRNKHERRPRGSESDDSGEDSEMTDPIYVRDTDVSQFVPLPQAESDAAAIVKPDDFVLYYKKDADDELDVAIPLYLAHRNTRNKFRLLSDLVRCYHLYRFTDARTGRMEVFPLWQGGILDDYE
ncbi:hypothetical protein ANCCEY_12524 [Ancylostoma ceylanicum]|uniref:Uncharacterized protein n=1 Tax=Ancylostoma ceylanicum TaxID=53326 RepID=A0A0D6LL95_9BILA|nr:hypothetical protein ANCCEY_12524 [Ancylostoma ceylanicum]